MALIQWQAITNIEMRVSNLNMDKGLQVNPTMNLLEGIVGKVSATSSRLQAASFTLQANGTTNQVEACSLKHEAN